MFFVVQIVGDNTHIRYMEAREGSNISVVCNISDSSNVTVYWTKNDTRYTFKPGKYLKLDHIKQINTGYYICHSLDNTSLPAYNGTADDIIADVIHIVVLGKL
jgi:predicted P-loop ATPase/GTPase